MSEETPPPAPSREDIEWALGLVEADTERLSQVPEDVRRGWRHSAKFDGPIGADADGDVVAHEPGLRRPCGEATTVRGTGPLECWGMH